MTSGSVAPLPSRFSSNEECLMASKNFQRPPRIQADEHCTVVRENGCLMGGFLVNLSDEGFCIDSNHPLELGERVEMRLAGAGRFHGIVRWRDSNRAGGVLEPYSRGAYD
jgi:PilZ domain